MQQDPPAGAFPAVSVLHENAGVAASYDALEIQNRIGHLISALIERFLFVVAHGALQKRGGSQ